MIRILTLASLALASQAIAKPVLILPPREDYCHMADAKPLIGRPVSEVPRPRHGYAHRFVCASCLVSTEFSPRRLNVIYDPGTLKVTALQCG